MCPWHAPIKQQGRAWHVDCKIHFPFFPIQITPQLILTLHLPFCAPGAVISELAQHGQEFSTLMEALAALPGGLSDKQHLLRYMTVNEPVSYTHLTLPTILLV